MWAEGEDDGERGIAGGTFVWQQLQEYSNYNNNNNNSNNNDSCVTRIIASTPRLVKNKTMSTMKRWRDHSAQVEVSTEAGGGDWGLAKATLVKALEAMLTTKDWQQLVR